MREPPFIRGLLESSLYVADLPRSREFYQEVFGFECLVSEDRFSVLDIAGREVLLLFQTGSARTPSATPGGTIPPHDGRGELHLAFAIAREDIEPWEARLRELAIPVESRVRWSRGGTSLYFRDPDRHLLELATPGLWPTY